MSRTSLALKDVSVSNLKICGKLVTVEKIRTRLNEIHLSHFFEYLDINTEGIVLKSQNYGLVSPLDLMNKPINDSENTEFWIHSIVGGG